MQEGLYTSKWQQTLHLKEYLDHGNEVSKYYIPWKTWINSKKTLFNKKCKVTSGKKANCTKNLYGDFIHLQIFPWPSFLCKLRVHTIAEKHNHYLTVCTMAQIPKQDHICRWNFFLVAFFLFELVTHDYTTLCMRSCKRHRCKWNVQNIVTSIFK